MIIQYHRPNTMSEAIELLAQPDTVPMGGGTWLNQPHDAKFSVVDLQALDLKFIHKHGNNLEVGAASTLQQLLENPHTPAALLQAIKLEAPLNIRNMATVAGRLVTCDGRSSFGTAMLALDAKLTFVNGQAEETIGIGEFLSLRPKGLITKITIPLNCSIAYEQVARTPADKPIVCAALAQWNSGRTRLALGGYGKGPLLAMDGTEADGLETAAKNAFHEAVDDFASADYRMDVAATLAKRCFSHLQA